MEPVTSERAPNVPVVPWPPIWFSRLVVAVAPYSPFNCCVSTTNSDFVPPGNELGNVPAWKLAGAPKRNVRAGQAWGIGGGGVVCSRKTYGVALEEPLYPETPIVARPCSFAVMITAASFASPRVVDELPIGDEPIGELPIGDEPIGMSCSVSDENDWPLASMPIPWSSIGDEPMGELPIGVEKNDLAAGFAIVRSRSEPFGTCRYAATFVPRARPLRLNE